MSLGYKVLYGIGFTPWEEMAELPAFTDRFAALFEREEAGRRPPYGPLLDLGCGSGIWAVQLARRGWEVTGVDIVRKALRRARRRADDAGVQLRLVEADVTRLGAADVGSGYPLLIDAGPCLRGLDSTVVDLTRSPARILRPGAVSLEEIEEVTRPLE